MNIERTTQGAWRISDVVNGYRESRQYFGYTKREAIAEFRADVAESQNKNTKEERA